MMSYQVSWTNHKKNNTANTRYAPAQDQTSRNHSNSTKQFLTSKNKPNLGAAPLHSAIRYVQAEKIEENTIDQIIEELITPAYYQHRNGFSNEHLVLNLTVQNKQEVEKRLIKMLETKDDELIGETLAILKSTDSLSSLNKRLISAKSGTSKIIWASFINEIKTARYLTIH